MNPGLPAHTASSASALCCQTRAPRPRCPRGQQRVPAPGGSSSEPQDCGLWRSLQTWAGVLRTWWREQSKLGPPHVPGADHGGSGAKHRVGFAVPDSRCLARPVRGKLRSVCRRSHRCFLITGHFTHEPFLPGPGPQAGPSEQYFSTFFFFYCHRPPQDIFFSNTPLNTFIKCKT